jgi:hypothetical protein
MVRNARPTRDPAGVLVVTVWSDVGGLRRVVRLTDPELHPADLALELRRNYAPSDKAVLSLVKSWLEAVGQRSHRPCPTP